MNLLPWKKKDEDVFRPLVSFQKRMNDLFEDFFHELPFSPVSGKGAFSPVTDLAETDKEYQITLELPGLSEKDVEIFLDNDVLTIKGEKKQEERNYHYIERRYGSFYRSIQLPSKVNAEKIQASFKNGVLSITLPKDVSSSAAKKIEIK